jgi:putative permease
VNFFVKSFAETHTPVVYAVLNKTKAVMKGYIVGLCIEMLIVAAMCFLGFMVLGIEYALLLAVITAVLNLIPYIGIFTAAILTLLITFATGSSTAVLGSLAVLLVVHFIDSNILLPRVVGSKVKINALITLLAVLVGSALWGIPGMFLSIPVVAILKVVFDSVETLNAWGFILGDEVVVNTAKKMPSFKKKPAAVAQQRQEDKAVQQQAEEVLEEDPSIGNK